MDQLRQALSHQLQVAVPGERLGERIGVHDALPHDKNTHAGGFGQPAKILLLLAQFVLTLTHARQQLAHAAGQLAQLVLAQAVLEQRPFQRFGAGGARRR